MNRRIKSSYNPNTEPEILLWGKEMADSCVNPRYLSIEEQRVFATALRASVAVIHKADAGVMRRARPAWQPRDGKRGRAVLKEGK